MLNSYTIRRARHDRFHTPRHQVTSGYAADQLGFTALHVAAQFGRDMLMELLVERGADLEARTAEGYAPEHVAAGAGQVAAIEWLIARGMDIARLASRHGAGDRAVGGTPRWWSAWRRSVEE